MSVDGTRFFVMGKGELVIFDVSNEISIISKKVIKLLAQGAEYGSMVVSEDKAVLFLLCKISETSYLLTIDISDTEAPELISSTVLPKLQDHSSMQLSRNKQTLIINLKYSIGVITVSNLKSPVITSVIKTNPKQTFMLSPDDKRVYLGNNDKNLTTIATYPEYGLHLAEQNFKIGGLYSQKIVPLVSKNQNQYANLEIYSKFVKLSIYKIGVSPFKDKPTITFQALPYWINFDKENAMLTIEPRSQIHLGSYQLYGAVSKVVTYEAFEKTPFTNGKSEATDLLLHLTGMGYLDNQGYITSNFDMSIPLLLNPTYGPNEKAIREILSRYYIETVNNIEVSPSLTLITDVDSLYINSLSQKSVAVSIQLITPGKGQARIVSRTYPNIHSTLSKNSTMINLEGPVLDMNFALHYLLIDLTDIKECDGKIIVSDGYNPTISQQINNISKFFKIIGPPIEDSNFPIQAQVNKVPIFTGQHFSIEFSPDSFSNFENDKLEYALKPGKDGLVAAWLFFRGLTLSGIPPEEASPSQFDFGLVVKNEFKEVRVPFV